MVVIIPFLSLLFWSCDVSICWSCRGDVQFLWDLWLSFVCGDTNLAVDGKVDAAAAAAALAIVAQSAKG